MQASFPEVYESVLVRVLPSKPSLILSWRLWIDIRGAASCRQTQGFRGARSKFPLHVFAIHRQVGHGRTRQGCVCHLPEQSKERVTLLITKKLSLMSTGWCQSMDHFGVLTVAYMAKHRLGRFHSPIIRHPDLAIAGRRTRSCSEDIPRAWCGAREPCDWTIDICTAFK